MSCFILQFLSPRLAQINQQTNVEFQFTFIGPIPEVHQIIDKRISYLGSITDNEKIKNVLTKSDILVCPSYSEGMPNVILEGMATGNAIIATDIGAVNQLVNRDNGWLISIKNIKYNLSKAIFESLDLKNETLRRMKIKSIEYFLLPLGHFVQNQVALQNRTS